MRLKSVWDNELLTRIRRSIGHVIMVDGKATTALFKFERLDCSELNLKRQQVGCYRVTVLSTGQVYIATEELFFGEPAWSLYREMK